MNKEFKLPDLGENIVSADIVRVLIKTGDHVAEDQPILEIETDKATIEVPSTINGIVEAVYVKEGEKVSVGQVVFEVVLDGSVASSEPEVIAEPVAAEVVATPSAEVSSEVAPVETTSGTKDLILQELGENINQAEVVKVLVKVGDILKEDDVVLEIETDKATIEVPSSISGKITEVYVEAGKKAKVGEAILKVETSVTKAAPVKPVAAAAPVAKSEPVKSAPVEQKVVTQQKIEIKHPSEVVSPAKILVELQPPVLPNAAPAAPSVRRLARELGVDVNKIPGTGPNRRISLNDVKAYVKRLNETRFEVTAQQKPSGSVIPQIPLPDFTKFGEIKKNAMSGIRAKTAERLSYAWQTIPHVTQFDKADITELEEIRKQLSPLVQKGGGKLTMTGILIKVIAAALKQFPQFNASVDMESKEIILKQYYNVGIAVDTEHGLIVPVIKGADSKSLTEISADLNTISEKARARKISPDDLSGGCFTISNLGGIGGTYFTPIVNTPEVAILGVSRSAFEPVYKNGEFVPRLMLPLSLSYDHRIIDGADAIRFLRWVIEALEQPMKLLI